MHTIKARIVGEESELGSFSTIKVHGCELSREFSKHEVNDFVFGKLKGNKHVEVLVKTAPDGPQEDDEAEAETPPARKPRGKKAVAETPPADTEA